jgi:hypothetical protein
VKPQLPCPHCDGTGFVALKFDAEKLVVAIADHAGDRAFTVRELMHHAEVVKGPLRSAIGNRSPRQLGKALRAISGRDFSGLSVEWIGKDRDGAIWHIVARV